MDLSSLLSALNRRLFKLTMALKGGQELLLESFAGCEGLSTDFGFQLDLIPSRQPFARSCASSSVRVQGLEVSHSGFLFGYLGASGCNIGFMR
jgi:hypothetical protein